MTTSKLKVIKPQTMDVLIKNRIHEICTMQGFKKFKPTPSLLNELGGISTHRFTKIMSNSLQPSFEETYRIAAWLNVDISDLFKLLILPSPKNSN